jgi:hypothetical protein
MPTTNAAVLPYVNQSGVPTPQSAKEAAQDENDQNIVYSRVPATTVATEINKQGVIKWQRQWNSTEKGALCRSFFPGVERRLKMKLPITPEFTALITGHGKTKSYLHRFKLADDPTCPCNEEVQTPEHVIYDCKILEQQRSALIRQIAARGEKWPPANNELVENYLNDFLFFFKSINFQQLI